MSAPAGSAWYGRGQQAPTPSIAAVIPATLPSGADVVRIPNPASRRSRLPDRNSGAGRRGSCVSALATTRELPVSTKASNCHVAEPRFILRPVHHLEFHLADAMAPAGIVFERHGGEKTRLSNLPLAYPSSINDPRTNATSILLTISFSTSAPINALASVGVSETFHSGLALTFSNGLDYCQSGSGEDGYIADD